MTQPGGRLAILLWSATPERPELLAAPFVYAAAAAALDAEVEMHFAGRAVRLLVAGEAAHLRSPDRGKQSIDVFMRQAAAVGARMLACSAALAEHVAPGETMVEEYSGAAGAAAFAQRALDPQWRTLVF
ncbi:MAG TPA: peroxiredoxin [Usitatibacter sp.]|nr:peroxiredoxin [Usitatibacter sp.]